jgi:hypothetical protein
MITLTICAAIIAGIIYLVREHIINKKTIYFNELISIYDSMEIYMLKNKLLPTNELLSFLKSFKYLVVNREFADIKIMLKLELMTSQKRKEENAMRFVTIKKSIHPELLLISQDFYRVYDKLIILSMFNFKFVFFVARVLFVSKYFAMKKSTTKKTETIISSIKALLHRENVVVYRFKDSQLSC